MRSAVFLVVLAVGCSTNAPVADGGACFFTMYHYVMTRDFPYSVACFRGTPTRNAFPPLSNAPPQSCN